MACNERTSIEPSKLYVQKVVFPFLHDYINLERHATCCVVFENRGTYHLKTAKETVCFLYHEAFIDIKGIIETSPLVDFSIGYSVFKIVILTSLIPSGEN